MNRWEFTVKELLALQQEQPDSEVVVKHYVEWVLLNGYKIKTSTKRRK
jgi:hypothetical protein